MGCETGWLRLLLETSPDKAAPMAAMAQRPELLAGAAQLHGGAAGACVINRLLVLTSITDCPGDATNAPEWRVNDAPRTAAPIATKAEPLEIALLAIMPGT